MAKKKTAEQTEAAPITSLLRARLAEEWFTIPGTAVAWNLKALTAVENAHCRAEAINSVGNVSADMLYYNVCKIGIKGWRGLEDDADPPQPVAYKFKRVWIEGQEVKIVAASIMQMMEPAFVGFLARRILEISNLTAREKKSSAATTPSDVSPGSAPGGEAVAPAVASPSKRTAKRQS